MTDSQIEYALRHYTVRTGGLCLHDPMAALIDMDGTLYDSMPWHARAWHRMVTELGIEAEVDEFFAYEGMTGRATINLLFERAFGHPGTDREVTELYKRKTEYFVENNHAIVMPGAQEMVKTFRQHGIMPVLVTGSGQATLINRLDEDFEGAFAPDRRVTSRDVTKGKPDPEPYLTALGIASVTADRAIVVENAPLGVQAGVAARVFTIAVNTGPIPRRALVEAGADIVFDSMVSCAETLSRLLYMVNSQLYYTSNVMAD